MNRRRALSVVLLAAGLAQGSSPAAGEELGRLFFTPAQRAELNHRNHGPSHSASNAARPITVNGRVTRSSGLGTVWVNGVAEHREGEVEDDARHVTLDTAAGGVRLKVGQTFVPGRGLARDEAANGIVRGH